jgi:hypothetical protein
MITMPPLLDARLQQRYQQLVGENLSPTAQVAAGLRSLPGTAQAFASTQAAYRFWSNDSVTLQQLAQPLLTEARVAVNRDCGRYALLVHDWSLVTYHRHTRKTDRVSLSQTNDLGYELQSGLLVSDRGDPLAPVYVGLRAADGVHSSISERVEPAPQQLDGLAPVMDFVQGLAWSKPVVHLIDREADSVGHYRQWDQAQHRFVVRADDERIVTHEKTEWRLPALVDHLRSQQAFRRSRVVSYHGQEAWQWVAEAAVVLTRPARHRRSDGTRETIPGRPLALRLVVAEVRSQDGQVLATWFLLTNVAADVSAAEIALWYYWRWRIESYFKLLKSAGHHLEQWQQETAAAVARRLLVVAMACVVVWRLQRRPEPEAVKLRKLLIRLSGRQMKRGVEATAPALLAGLWTMLSMLTVLEHYDLDELRQLIKEAGLENLVRKRCQKVV